MPKMNRT
jgi:hypothetical protein